jgi:myo-inositol 2-dehydrogenase/D-chiro-inositol 1-dehydrogenase
MESSRKKKQPIGLAIVGSGRIGRTRALIAQHFPAVEWMGLCDLREGVGLRLQEEVGADYFCTDYRDLLERPEVNAVIIATEENEHVLPTIMAAERGHRLFIEKPLATDPHESEKVLKAVQASGVDAAVGYTQRFRRRFLLAKEKVRSGGLGEVTSVTVKAFMNRMSAITTVQKAKDTSRLTPMVVSGTHSLDLAMWLLEGKKPVEVYARSVDKALGAKYGTKDATFGIFTFDDGTIWSMCISWALPVPWPGQTYGLDIGIVGTTGVLTIDDTHRDLVLATEEPHLDHRPNDFRKVSFLTSYPPGDMSLGQYRGPIREETNAWLTRIYSGMETQHATVADAHRNLLLTIAMDKSAATGKPVKLPVTPDDLA